MRLRDADWLTANRAGVWCRVLAALSAIGVAGFLALSHDGVDPFGRPLGTDFLSFWTAARLTLAGNAAGAYDPVIHAAAQQAAFPSAPGYYAFFYPPTFLLICLPLALLPYGWALLCWLAAGFATFIAVARRLVPRAWAWLPLLAFPGNLINLGHGQNGFVTGACLGGFVVLYRRRPFLAGLCLGALVIKPHLLLAGPFRVPAARYKLQSGPGGAISCKLQWTSKEMCNDVVSSVLHKEFLYGFDLKQLQASPHRAGVGTAGDQVADSHRLPQHRLFR